MKLSKSFTFVIFLSTLFSASCARTAPPSSSSAGALTANSSLNNAPLRSFGRHNLNAAGSTYLNDFIRPEVRARLDEEPGGDADGGYDPSTADAGTSSDQPGESGGDTQNDESTRGAGDNEEEISGAPRVDTLKYSWA